MNKYRSVGLAVAGVFLLTALVGMFVSSKVRAGGNATRTFTV